MTVFKMKGGQTPDEMMNTMHQVITLIAVWVIFTVADASAKNLVPITDLNQALATARTEQKLLFVKYGSRSCRYCRSLDHWMKSQEIKINEAVFIYADINSDHSMRNQLFHERFKVDGSNLPYVIIASPEGKQIAARSGSGSKRNYRNFISDAERAYRGSKEVR